MDSGSPEISKVLDQDEQMDVDKETLEEKSDSDDNPQVKEEEEEQDDDDDDDRDEESSENPTAPEIKEKTLSEFLTLIEQYQPLIPDAVTEYYLQKTGFECEDIRIKRLLALATQKFISDVVTDAFHYSKIRMQGTRDRKLTGKDKKVVLTAEDLSSALSEYGINVKKPEYYS